MKIITRNFGEIEIDEQQLFTFKDGIPGFETLTKYILIEEAKSPFTFMQSVEDGDICLTLIEALKVITNYEIDIEDHLLNHLGDLTPENMKLFSVLVVPEQSEKMTTNLKAPIIVNRESRKAKQFTLSTDKWSMRHPVYNELKAYAKKAGEEAC